MEAQELFRRLGAGARFDVQRFGRDARRFGVRSYWGGGAGRNRAGPEAAQRGSGPFPSARCSPARTRGLVAALGILTAPLRVCHPVPRHLLQVIRGSGGTPENLDFFGRKEGGASLGSAGKQEDGAGRKDVEMAGKRKRTAESGQRKRKKIQGVHVYMYAIEFPDKVHSSCFGLC